MCIPSIIGESYGLYVALYDNDNESLDWALVVVPKVDSQPFPTSVPATMDDMPSGGAYAVFDIASVPLVDDQSWSRSTLNEAEIDEFARAQPEKAAHNWTFRQRRVENIGDDSKLVAIFQVARLPGSRDVAKLVRALRSFPLLPSVNTPASDGEYVLVDSPGSNDGQIVTTDVLTAPVSEKALEAWNSASWVLRALDQLRPRHPRMPSQAKIETAVSVLGSMYHERHAEGQWFSFAECTQDIRDTDNVRAFPIRHGQYEADYHPLPQDCRQYTACASMRAQVSRFKKFITNM